ncbi:MAG: RNA polymerase sigma factor [Flavobacteriales bacterium]|nr:RNA polymerase sigma factor [Flavobacteriales bacterium]
MTDKRLIKALQKGDRSAFKVIYDKYVNYFYAIAIRYADNSAEAEDYVQEAFVRIYRNINSFSFQGSFEGWMKRILVNHCLNGIKKKNPLKQSEDITVIPDSSGGISADALSEINSEDIMKAISELPTGYRTVLNMYVIEGYSHREIGEELGITESSSRSQLTKARMKLKHILLSRGLVSEHEVRFAS